ncbi:hypothetical protein D0469_17850 [Peribacillus saganii]|uniref:Amidohydrolase 3 domain-containing protein n=1 Tax=Peribacillus saganii TaxID=2303992 RepID=A0A372LIJ3_9BACI|nr:hypothetical protein D0469_17850 [Peribacillus saganii]
MQRLLIMFIIKESFNADFTVLDSDIFRIHSDQLLQAKAVMTVVNGDIVFEIDSAY